MYIDTHSHIYLQEFDAERKQILQNASDSSVDIILMPAVDSQTHAAMLQLEVDYPQQCISMMGLHPCSVKESFEKELAIVENHLKQRKYIAIGETGLDFYWDLTYKNEQYIAFEKQIEWAINYNVPIVIHSRESTDACIEVVKKYISKGLKGVFHCFGGSLEQARAITDMDFYLGIGGVLTFKKSGLDAAMLQMPLDKVILETDAPYLAPVPYRGKRNEPSHLVYIAQKLAELKNTSIQEIAAITTRNAKALFSM